MSGELIIERLRGSRSFFCATAKKQASAKTPQKDEETKRQRDKETKRLKDKERKRQKTKRQREEETKRRRDEETKGPFFETLMFMN